MHSWSLLAYRFTLAYIQHTFVIAWKLYINRVVFGAIKTENVDVGVGLGKYFMTPDVCHVEEKMETGVDGLIIVGISIDQ